METSREIESDFESLYVPTFLSRGSSAQTSLRLTLPRLSCRSGDNKDFPSLKFCNEICSPQQ